MEGTKILTIAMIPCPECGGKTYKYHPLEERKTYKGEIVVGKYECRNCNSQFEN